MELPTECSSPCEAVAANDIPRACPCLILIRLQDEVIRRRDKCAAFDTDFYGFNCFNALKKGFCAKCFSFTIQNSHFATPASITMQQNFAAPCCRVVGFVGGSTSDE